MVLYVVCVHSSQHASLRFLRAPDSHDACMVHVHACRYFFPQRQGNATAQAHGMLDELAKAGAKYDKIMIDVEAGWDGLPIEVGWQRPSRTLLALGRLVDVNNC